MKKGFTLIEMLVTIVIIAVLVGIGVTVYIGLNNRSKQRLYETKVGLVETNAEKWAEDMNLTEPMSISIDRLVKDGYQEADQEEPGEEYELQVIDPRDNRVMNCDIVNISFENGNIIAKHIEIEDCSIVSNITDDEKITIRATERPITSGDKTYYTAEDAKGGINGILSWTRHNVRLTLDEDLTEYKGEINWYQNGNKITVKDHREYIDIEPALLLQSVYTVTIDDKSGIKKKNITVRIDKEAPKDLDIVMTDFGKWINREANTTIKSSDLGSGIKEYQYSIDGKNWTTLKASATLSSLNVTKYNVKEKNQRTIDLTFDIAKQTFINQNFYLRVIDNVDNEVENYTQIKVMIDRYIPPTPTLTNTSNGNWVTTQVGVTGTTTEQGSGIRAYQYSEDGTNWVDFATNTSKGIYAFSYTNTEKTKISVTYNTTTELNKNIRVRAVDNVGNTSGTASTNIKIDKLPPTPPTYGTATPGGSSAGGATDSGSGIKEYLYIIEKTHKTVNPTKPTNTDPRWSKVTTWTLTTNECDTKYSVWAIAVDNMGNRSSVYALTPYYTKVCCTPKTNGSACSSGENGTVYTCEGSSWRCTSVVTGQRGNWSCSGCGGSGGGNIATYYCNRSDRINMGGDYLGNQRDSNYGVVSGDGYTLWNYGVGYMVGNHSATCNIHTTYYAYYWYKI